MTTSKREDLRRFRRRRVTLSQLAAQLEVPTATVFLALRDNPAVSAETLQARAGFAAEMGYIYNRQAASLRTARTDIVGVVVHDVLNPYFAEVFRAVESEARDIRPHHPHLQSPRQHRAPAQFRPGAAAAERRRPGVSPLGRHHGGRHRGHHAHRHAGQRWSAATSTAPTPRACAATTATACTKSPASLIGKGHKDIAFVGGLRSTSSGRDRYAGFREAMTEAA